MPKNAALRFWSADAARAARVAVIAEIGVNHDGDPAVAGRLIAAAAAAGADAVKFQYFTPGRLLSAQAELAAYQQGKAADARSLLESLTLSVEVLARLRDRARACGVGFVVTPFSPADCAQLRALELDAVKIASPDAVNPVLLDAAAALGRPMLVSTGTCDLEELDRAAAVVAHNGGALLHCVSSYPTADQDAALGGIAALQKKFGTGTDTNIATDAAADAAAGTGVMGGAGGVGGVGVVSDGWAVGYSDHTTSLDTGALAAAAGACVLEKHLTHDRSAAGPDHAASLEPAGFTQYVRAVRRATAMVGPIAKGCTQTERDVRRVSRQSLCMTADRPAGHTLTAEDLTVKRPGTGLPAARIEDVVGRVLARDVTANDLLREQDLQG